jgi:hypothetical protein
MGWFDVPPPVDDKAPLLAKLGGSPVDLMGYLLAITGAVTIGALGMNAAERAVWGKGGKSRAARASVRVYNESGSGDLDDSGDER